MNWKSTFFFMICDPKSKGWIYYYLVFDELA